MRRKVLQPQLDAALREQAAKVYSAIGLEMPPERKPEDRMRSRSHGGFEIISTFFPTAKGPKLNVIHGPLVDKEGMHIPKDVIGLPIVGAALRARAAMERPVRQKRMEVDDEEYNRPSFYPRRDRKSGCIRKKRKTKNRSTGTKKGGVGMEVSATA